MLYPLRTNAIVQRPMMLQSWKDVAFVHWRYDPEVVQKRLPDGLTVDTFEGSAWVGVVAFHMEQIRPPGAPGIPYLGTFPETNVRTYVRGQDDQPGVWFDSLDVNRLVPVAVARLTYRLPYMWSKMEISGDAIRRIYTARRRWPDRGSSASSLALRRSEPIAPEDLEPVERFLTSRWGLSTMLRSRLAYAPVDHPAWPLERARLDALDDQLVRKAGYPEPLGAPLVHYSTGVDVRIGLPRTIRS